MQYSLVYLRLQFQILIVLLIGKLYILSRHSGQSNASSPNLLACDQDIFQPILYEVLVWNVIYSSIVSRMSILMPLCAIGISTDAG